MSTMSRDSLYGTSVRISAERAKEARREDIKRVRVHVGAKHRLGDLGDIP